MTNVFSHRALFALSLAVLPAVQAGYNPAVVAADARWVVFADFEGLRASALGKELVSAIEKAQTQATNGTITLDVPRLLSSVGTVTAYGNNLTPDPNAIDGALVVQGTADLRKIVESVLLQGTLAEPKAFAETTDLPFPGYTIRDPKAQNGAAPEVFVAFPPEPVILVSKSKAQLLKARDVVRGSAPSLKQGGAPAFTQLASNTSGAYLFVASSVPAEPLFPQNAPQARILQLASSGAVTVGERGPNLFAHIELLASSEANAERLGKILEGMTAVLAMTGSNDRELTEFINSTTVSRDKSTIKLQLAAPTTRLVQLTQNLHTRMEGRPATRPAPPISQGRVLAEWLASESPVAPGADPAALTWRTIDDVKLVNGATISLGRQLNGGKNIRWDRCEIVPTNPPGAPLIFRSEFMRSMRGTMTQFQFPGSDGTYTLKVAYVNDPEGKAKFAVSVSEPKAPAPAPAPGSR